MSEALQQSRKSILIGAIIFFFFVLAALADAFGVWSGMKSIFSVNASSEAERILIAPLPTGVPPATPKPTVAGTPLPWHGVAAGGKVGFEIEANGILLVVDELAVFPMTQNDIPAHDGYLFVVVKLRVSNNSWISISPSDFYLVDDSSNQYVQRSTLGFESLPAMGFIRHSETVAGALVYEVPKPALNNSLRLRLEPESHADLDQDTRIEVFFDSALLK